MNFKELPKGTELVLPQGITAVPSDGELPKGTEVTYPLGYTPPPAQDYSFTHGLGELTKTAGNIASGLIAAPLASGIGTVSGALENLFNIGTPQAAREGSGLDLIQQRAAEAAQPFEKPFKTDPYYPIQDALQALFHLPVAAASELIHPQGMSVLPQTEGMAPARGTTQAQVAQGQDVRASNAALASMVESLGDLATFHQIGKAIGGRPSVTGKAEPDTVPPPRTVQPTVVPPREGAGVSPAPAPSPDQFTHPELGTVTKLRDLKEGNTWVQTAEGKRTKVPTNELQPIPTVGKVPVEATSTTPPVEPPAAAVVSPKVGQQTIPPVPAAPAPAPVTAKFQEQEPGAAGATPIEEPSIPGRSRFQQIELTKLGYTPEQQAAMTDTDALHLISTKTGPKPVEPVKPVEAVKPVAPPEPPTAPAPPSPPSAPPRLSPPSPPPPPAEPARPPIPSLPSMPLSSSDLIIQIRRLKNTPEKSIGNSLDEILPEVYALPKYQQRLVLDEINKKRREPVIVTPSEFAKAKEKLASGEVTPVASPVKGEGEAVAPPTAEPSKPPPIEEKPVSELKKARTKRITPSKDLKEHLAMTPSDLKMSLETDEGLKNQLKKELKDKFGIDKPNVIEGIKEYRMRQSEGPPKGRRGEAGGVITDIGNSVVPFSKDVTYNDLVDQVKRVLKLKQDVKLSGTGLYGRLRNVLNPSEFEYLNSVGLEKFLATGSHSPSDVAKWISENSPKIETHTYGMEGKVSEAKAEYDKMTHEWYETLPKDVRQRVDYVTANHMEHRSDRRNEMVMRLPEDMRKDAIKYAKLWDTVQNEPRDTSPRATSAYNYVSPKDPKTHPVVRVDVVIPNKLSEADIKAYESNKRLGITEEKNKAAFPEILWSPDNIHENLPNTLGWAAYQMETLPDGSKAAHIFEIQSRWAQSVREAKNKVKTASEHDMQSPYAQRHVELANNEHPLLRDYNRLVLKAVLKHIEELNKTLPESEKIKRVVLSDKDTAMMTEGHDLVPDTYYVQPTEQNITAAKAQMQKYKGMVSDAGVDAGIILSGKKFSVIPTDVENYKGRGYTIDGPYKEVTQEPGMRLNYDTILPKIMEELTGQKGERVSLGEHKNAFMNKGEDFANQPGEGTIEFGESQLPSAKIRANLIFKNPDGTPKTDVSGLSYPLDKVKPEFSLFGKDKATKIEPGQIPPGRRGEMGGSPVEVVKEVTEKAKKLISKIHPTALKDAIKMAQVKWAMRDQADQMKRFRDAMTGITAKAGTDTFNEFKGLIKDPEEFKWSDYLAEAMSLANDVNDPNFDIVKYPEDAQYIGKDYKEILQDWTDRAGKVDTEQEGFYKSALNANAEQRARAQYQISVWDEQQKELTGHGVPVGDHPGYVPQQYDISEVTKAPEGSIKELFTKGEGNRTRMQQAERKYSHRIDAIEAGIFPEGDVATRAAKRVESGMAKIQEKVFLQKMSEIIDPTSHLPFFAPRNEPFRGSTIAVQRTLAGKKITDARLRDDYVPVTINGKEYYVLPQARTLINDLFSPDVSKAKMLQSYIRRHKATSIFVDTYHIAQVIMRGNTTKGVIGAAKALRKGKNPLEGFIPEDSRILLEHNERDIHRMLDDGEITQEMHDQVMSKKADFDKGMANGLLVSRYAQEFGELMQKDGVLHNSTRWIFESLSRSLMTDTYFKFLERGRNRNKGRFSDDQIVRVAVRKANQAFGQVGRQGWLTSATARSYAKLVAFAPQWFEASLKNQATFMTEPVRMAGKLAKGEVPYPGDIASTFGAITLGWFVGNQIINVISQGHPTWENKDKEHKWDAKVGDYYISPFAQTSGIALGTIEGVREGKQPLIAFEDALLGHASMPWQVARQLVGHPPGSHPELGTAHRFKQAALEIAPIPTFGLREAGKTLSEEGVGGLEKVQVGRIAASAAGVRLKKEENLSPEAVSILREHGDMNTYASSIASQVISARTEAKKDNKSYEERHQIEKDIIDRAVSKSPDEWNKSKLKYEIRRAMITKPKARSKATSEANRADKKDIETLPEYHGN